jgi:hypothetical protein
MKGGTMRPNDAEMQISHGLFTKIYAGGLA